MTLVVFALALWVTLWALNVWLANGPWRDRRAARIAVPLIFGVTVLIVWELLVPRQVAAD